MSTRPRTPQHFPLMKVRGRRRRRPLWRLWDADWKLMGSARDRTEFSDLMQLLGEFDNTPDLRVNLMLWQPDPPPVLTTTLPECWMSDLLAVGGGGDPLPPPRLET